MLARISRRTAVGLAVLALPLAAAAQEPPMPRALPEAGVATGLGAEPENEAEVAPATEQEPDDAAPETEGEAEPDIEAEAQPERPAEPAVEEVDPDFPAALAPLPRPTPVGPRRPAAGWTLRAVPDALPVALGGGPGRVVSVAAFCLGGRPWLALELFPEPEAERVRVDFGFADTRLEASALKEEGAGGAYVIELADGPLVELLAGDHSVAALGLDGTQQGQLSLEGSSHAIRAALEPCHAF